MTIFVGIDNTGNSESIGTGKFARQIAKKLSSKYNIYGVTRHQFYAQSDILYSLHNFGAVIHMDTHEQGSIHNIFEIVKTIMLDNFNEGSNPGLAAAYESSISPALVAFGQDAKNKVLQTKIAINLAKNSGILLEGMGKTGDGIIGAMAGIGLAYTKNDGRFLQIGRVRKLKGPQPAEKLLNAGIDKIFTLDGRRVITGIIINDGNKPMKPSPVNGEVILFVDEENGIFKAVNKD